MTTRRILVLGFLLSAVGLAYSFGLHSTLTLENLKAQHARLSDLTAMHQFASPAIYFAVYVLIAALSIPGATVLTLAAGALFGTSGGILLVSFASTLGALLAFLSARFVLRRTVELRFAERLAAVNAGIARDGAFYLFTLRLVPALPFFVVNLVMGLTRMKALPFALVSQIGMLPATAVFVNAGTRLAEIETAGDVLSPALVLSLMALGLLPWGAKLAIGVLKRRKLYSRFERPRRFDRNLVVVGAGAAGLVAAYVAATLRAKVTLVEGRRMGGDCLNSGCVPSKALIKASKVAHLVRHAAAYGIDSTVVGVRWREVMSRVRQAVDEVAPHDSVERYTGLGVEVIEGCARLVDPWTVEISGAGAATTRLTSHSIVIATGAAPVVPDLPGLDQVGFVTSDTLWADLAERDAVPGRIAVLGGGPIGCELAQALQRLGATVTIVEAAERLLVREDPEVSAFAEQALRAEGIDVRVGHRATACEMRSGEKLLALDCAGVGHEIAFDSLIVAVGRAARLSGFGLEELGIPAARVVETNEYLETIYPNIYAAGDVAGPHQLTHAAGHQGWHAAVNALFGRFRRFPASYSAMPAVTFLDPEIARVGLNESEAAARRIANEVTRYEIEDLDRAIADGTRRGFVKVLTVPGKDRILGATIVGAEAGEMIAEFALAMRHGLGLNSILSTVHAYPTRVEANKAVAGLWKRAHAPEWVLKLVARLHAWERGH